MGWRFSSGGGAQPLVVRNHNNEPSMQRLPGKWSATLRFEVQRCRGKAVTARSRAGSGVRVQGDDERSDAL